MVNERIKSLRSLMDEQNIDIYIIPSEDYHQSEYVGDYFKARAFISGFTGSAGLVVVTKDSSYLWTDGRYFTQAAIELEGSEVLLQKMGEPDVPTVPEFITDNLEEGGVLAFDGRCVSVSSGQAYEDIVKDKGGKLIYDVDLVAKIWTDRPSLPKKPAFFLEEKYTGESSVSKLAKIRQEMKSIGADIHIIASLDDVCWIINTRGQDVMYSPLLLSYLVITEKEVFLFVDESKLNDEILENLKSINANVLPYDDIYEFLKDTPEDKVALIDTNRLNYAMYKNIPCSIRKIEKLNPSQLLKAMKNEVEVENIKKAHVNDGIAWVKFMRWLKANVGKMEISEIDASDKLAAYRAEQEGYLWPSFAPISGYRSNGAIVHYSANPETQSMLEAKSLYLSDTGGNYYTGTTDITRTLALGELTEEEKRHFTYVLKAHSNLAMAKFLKGTSGYALDILARKPLWDAGLDFNHGTGHGVGYLLNVHEGPQGIRYKINPAKSETQAFELGMVVTNEPGLYIEGKHGIRIENELLVVEDETTDFGEFYKFENVTYVPIDLDAIEITMLNEEEKAYLNSYHKLVYDIIAPHLNEEEKAWLKEYTRSI